MQARIAEMSQNVTGILCALSLVMCVLIAEGCSSPDYYELQQEEDIEVLIEALEHGDSPVRINAAYILGQRGDARAVEPLIAALEDDGGGGAASAAIDSLGDIGDMRATEPLIAILSTHDNAALRSDAAAALGQLGDMRAVPALVKTMTSEGSRSDRRGEGDVAASALRWLVKERQELSFETETHAALLESLFTLLDSESLPFRADAALLLGLMGDATAIEPLSRASSGGNPEVYRALAQALETVMVRIAKDDMASLAAYLDHPEREVQDAALAALIAENDIEALLALLKHPDWHMRLRAAQALGRTGNSLAVEALVAALDDPDSDVAGAAARALGELGDERAVGSLIELSESDRAKTDYLLRQSILAALQKAHPDFNRFVLAKLNREDTALLWYSNVINLGVEDAVPALIRALSRFGDVAMAEKYLNCGHADLEAAAGAWAEENGYLIAKAPQLSGGGPSWGGD